jgi:hypothetical protein
MGGATLMAETEFARLDQRGGIDRIEGAAPADPLATSRTVRADPRNYMPLDLQHPLQRSPAPESPHVPAPEQTETEMRERLADALQRKQQTDQALAEARARHEQAIRKQQRCADAVAGFLHLDREIEQAMIDTLRGVARVVVDDAALLPEALRGKLHEREEAKIALAAVQNAAGTFLREVAEAVTADQQASFALNAAVRALTDLGRARLRDELAPLESKLAAYRQLIRWGDASPPWAEVVAGLKADPMTASFELASVPDEPEPEGEASSSVAMPPAMPSMVTLMRPDGPPEVVTQAEFARRSRAPASVLTTAQKEAIAVDQARRSVGG